MLNGADEAADFRPSGGGRDHTDTSTGIHRRRRELEKKRGEAMRGGMKRGGATLEEMKQALEGKLYIGKKIKKIVCFRESSTGPMQKDKKTGTVTGMYPFVFTVDFGKYTESFRYGQFFEEGSEKVRL